MAAKDYPTDLPHTIMFPDVDGFDDLFESFTFDKEQAPPDVELAPGTGRGRIRSYIGMPDFAAGYVALRPDYLHRLVSSMFADLTISFRAISHASTGYTLIIADYSEIIGSYWLAYVRTDTLPTEAK